MKNTNFLKAMLFVCILMVSYDIGHAQDKAGAPAQEYSLNVSLQQVTGEILSQRAANFISYFKTVGKSFASPYVTDSINKSGYDFLTSVFIKFLTANPPKAPYFTAMHVFLGLDVSDNVKLVFVPIVADSFMHINGKDSFILAPLATSAATRNNFDNSDSIYIINKGSLLSISAATAQPFIDNYQHRILIDAKGPGSSKFRSFANTGTVTGDVQSLIYSCQAISAVHSDPAKPTIYITSISEMDEFHHLDSFKHTIAFSNVLPGGSDTVLSICSNLATMCPPACNGGLSINASRIVTNVLFIDNIGAGQSFSNDNRPGYICKPLYLWIAIGVLIMIIILLMIKRNKK